MATERVRPSDIPEVWVERPAKRPCSGEPSKVWLAFSAGEVQRTGQNGKIEFMVRCEIAGCSEKHRYFWIDKSSTARVFTHLRTQHGLSSKAFKEIAGDATKLRTLKEQGRAPKKVIVSPCSG